MKVKHQFKCGLSQVIHILRQMSWKIICQSFLLQVQCFQVPSKVIHEYWQNGHAHPKSHFFYKAEYEKYIHIHAFSKGFDLNKRNDFCCLRTTEFLLL